MDGFKKFLITVRFCQFGAPLTIEEIVKDVLNYSYFWVSLLTLNTEKFIVDKEALGKG